MTFFFKFNRTKKVKVGGKPASEMIKGTLYGYWMILGEAAPKRNKSGRLLRFAVCKCTACNKTIREVRYDSLKSKRENTLSCCLGAEICRQVNTVHGFRNHPIRSTHRNMIERCYNPKCKKYKYYGGRGIKICDEWRHDLGAFGNWALANGYEKGLQIDRKNNDGNYEPSNCRFVTKKLNMNNMSKNLFVKYKGVRYSFTELWEKFGKVKYSTARHRYQCQGLSAIDSVTLPV